MVVQFGGPLWAGALPCRGAQPWGLCVRSGRTRRRGAPAAPVAGSWRATRTGTGRWWPSSQTKWCWGSWKTRPIKYSRNHTYMSYIFKSIYPSASIYIYWQIHIYILIHFVLFLFPVYCACEVPVKVLYKYWYWLLNNNMVYLWFMIVIIMIIIMYK